MLIIQNHIILEFVKVLIIRENNYEDCSYTFQFRWRDS
jgi:hypothetical protein